MRRMSKEQLLLVLTDIFVVGLALILGLRLRFEGQVPVRYWALFHRTYLPIAFIHISVIASFGLYNQLWCFASIHEVLAMVKAVSISNILIWGVAFFMRTTFYPRSVLIISWFLILNFTGGIRFILRCYQQHRQMIAHERKNEETQRGRCETEEQDTRRVLIVGAGDGGRMVLEELRKHSELSLEVVGYVDDDPRKIGREIRGVKILDTTQKIADIVDEKNIDEIILAIPSAPGSDVRRILDCCKKTDAEVRILPGVYEIIDGRIRFDQIREVRVEDLLRRDPVNLDLDSISSYVQDRVVMITGGGGSIGSEIAKQLVRFKPKKLVIFDFNENNLYRLQHELKGRFPQKRLAAVIGDVRERDRLDAVFSRYRPEVVFHAAAHKHVPLMEHNPEEAVKNNIFGTRSVAGCADEHGVDRFVLISTDKAVNPTNVMGATKRVAEMIVEDMNRISGTRFLAVRFGNVLGSRGSVVPLFKRQIRRGGPVEVTHPEITRYFMTIPEAAQLVLQTAALGEGGELFVLDMGEPVRILDLARDLIRLSGLEPKKDIEIKIIGLRPGEKLYEEPLTAAENTEKTRHEKIHIARLRSVETESLHRQLADLERAVTRGAQKELLRDLLVDLVDGYNPQVEIDEDLLPAAELAATKDG